MNTYAKLIEKFVSWAEASGEVKSVFVVGSRARTDRPADEFSDLDLVMVVNNPEYFIQSTEWLKNIGKYWASFIEGTAVGGGQERRVLFEDALDVDFAVFSEDAFKHAIETEDVQAVFKRGFRVLVDKIGMADALPSQSAERPVCPPPSEKDFLNLVNDFWYHTVWTTKKLQRGELWAAKMCVDNYMKWQLLRMIECHARAVNGQDYDTWHSGRFIDIWAEQRVREGLQGAFAHYDKKDMGRALLATMDLFRSLAVEAAEKSGFQYPDTADESTTGWVRKVLAELV